MKTSAVLLSTVLLVCAHPPGRAAGQSAPEAAALSWAEGPALAEPRDHHAVFLVTRPAGAYPYAAGGTDYKRMLGGVLRAPIRPDGTLGEWQIVSRMPYAYGTHSAFAHRGRIWVLGGVEDNSRFVDAVWSAELREDGRVGPWHRVEPGLPLARGHVHDTPVLDDRVYSVGGRILPASPQSPWVTGAAHVGRFVGAR